MATSAYLPHGWDERAATVRANGMGAIADAVLARWFTPAFAAAHPDVVAPMRERFLALDPRGYAVCCGAIRDMDLRASNARIGSAMSEYFPKVSLSGLVGSATTAGGSAFTGGAAQAQGVLGLRWRLFDFGRIDAQIAQARGREAESLAAYRLAVLHATEDVENAFSTLAHRSQQAAVLVRGEDALARARASSFAAYQRGAASLIDVLHADETVLRTADARAQAQADAARAAVAAYKALGGGWDPDTPPHGTENVAALAPGG